MGKRKKTKEPFPFKDNKHNLQKQQSKIVNSLLDEMKDNCEYQSIVHCIPENLDLVAEIRRSLIEISTIRKRPIICYLANVVNVNTRASITIDTTDDLPFSEMVENIDSKDKCIDIILVTPGGSAEQVAKFVNKLRPRFDSVGFILPYLTMSAGTIFCLSGDEVIMDSRAYIGPIDPQVPAKDGRFIPAQSIFSLLNKIEADGKALMDKGLSPNWTDIQILNNLDGREIGNAITASEFSIELVTEYLHKYKFKTWTKHSSTGQPVTEEEKQKKAEEIAMQLCDHSIWKTHSRGITREMAYDMCKLKISHPEDILGLLRSIRRFWALAYWILERTAIYKAFISENYTLFKLEKPIKSNNKE